MKILQLCCFTNLWNKKHDVTSIDLKLNKDIFQLTEEEIKNYDLICAAPPCDQFTKANSLRWQTIPHDYIKIAIKCLEICKKTNKYWFIENPPGRIEKFIPELSRFRITTWRDRHSNKEYVLYGNFLITYAKTQYRYNKKPIKRLKKHREEWTPQLITDIENSINS